MQAWSSWSAVLDFRAGACSSSSCSMVAEVGYGCLVVGWWPLSFVRRVTSMCEIESRSLRSKAGYLGGLGVERGGNTYALVGDRRRDGRRCAKNHARFLTTAACRRIIIVCCRQDDDVLTDDNGTTNSNL